MAAILMTVAVAEPASLNAVDGFARTRLMSTLGHSVSLHASAGAVPANVGDYALVVFSTSMQNNQTSKWDAITVPILSLDLSKFLHTKISTQNFASGGDTRLGRYLMAHAVNASLTGQQDVYSASTPPSTGYKWLPTAAVAAGVTKTAYQDSAVSRITGIALDPGAVMHDGVTSPSRRATLPFHETNLASAIGLSIFDAHVAWLLGSGGGGSAPAAPTGVSATVSTNDVTVSWTASSGATSYVVHRSTTSGFTADGTTQIASGVTATSYADNDRPNGTYYYRVVAVNASGSSAASTQASATVDYTPPVDSLAQVWDGAAWRNILPLTYDGTWR